MQFTHVISKEYLVLLNIHHEHAKQGKKHTPYLFCENHCFIWHTWAKMAAFCPAVTRMACWVTELGLDVAWPVELAVLCFPEPPGWLTRNVPWKVNNKKNQYSIDTLLMLSASCLVCLFLIRDRMHGCLNKHFVLQDYVVCHSVLASKTINIYTINSPATFLGITLDNYTN